MRGLGVVVCFGLGMPGRELRTNEVPWCLSTDVFHHNGCLRRYAIPSSHGRHVVLPEHLPLALVAFLHFLT